MTKTQLIGLLAVTLGALGLGVLGVSHGIAELLTFMPGAIVGTALTSKMVRLLGRGRTVSSASHSIWTGVGAVVGTCATLVALVAQQGGIGSSSSGEVLRAFGQVTVMGLGYGAVIGGIIAQRRVEPT